MNTKNIPLKNLNHIIMERFVFYNHDIKEEELIEFAKQLPRMRMIMNTQYEELSLATGVHIDRLSSIERNLTLPTKDEYGQICTYFMKYFLYLKTVNKTTTDRIVSKAIEDFIPVLKDRENVIQVKMLDREAIEKQKIIAMQATVMLQKQLEEFFEMLTKHTDSKRNF